VYFYLSFLSLTSIVKSKFPDPNHTDQRTVPTIKNSPFYTVDTYLYLYLFTVQEIISFQTQLSSQLYNHFYNSFLHLLYIEPGFTCLCETLSTF
jgi:hypothetical protein